MRYVTITGTFIGVIPLALLSGLPLSRIVRVALVPNFIMQGLPLALPGQNDMVAISSTFYVGVAFCRIFLKGWNKLYYNNEMVLK